MSRLTLPIFPLHSVLFPGGPLALRIFEPRYLDMVSRCLKEERGFGVCLIKKGSEVGPAAEVYSVGTLGQITYWYRRADGLLGVTLLGKQRFRILEQRVEPNQLLVAEVELLPNAPSLPVPDSYQGLVAMLQRIMGELDHPYINLPRQYEDAGWVGARLVELLPLAHSHKQRLLQEEEPLRRLEVLLQLTAHGDKSKG
ncbi:MAG: LON peptidase substrate-binding domain-containing protein [Gammaproteobacteria bacterium]|nr:LON peptidase substrate-binding domain-containing protein [Gammaproteobacteria bacterium]